MPVIDPTGSRASLSVPAAANSAGIHTAQASARLRSVEQRLNTPSTPLVTALPSSPYLGQEVLYQHEDMYDAFSGPVWRLRYDSDPTRSNKWMFIGGSDIVANGDPASAQSLAANTATEPTNALTIPIPLKGNYIIGHNGQVLTNVDCIFNVSIYDAANNNLFNPGATNKAGEYQWTGGQRAVTISAPTTLRIVLQATSAVQMSYYGAALWARPIRVGT